jgi:endonuclease YncB( thermonuclease family)
MAVAPAPAVDLTGRASVIDGDTIEMHGQRIRLHGIDAPEEGQTCDDASGAPYRCSQAAALAPADRDRRRHGRVRAAPR